MRRTLAALLVCLAAGLAGCTVAPGSDDDDGDDDDDSLVKVARHSASLFSQTTGLAIVAVDPLAAGVADEVEAAARAAAAASGYFAEGGCLGAAVEPQRPDQVVLTFDDCEGPYGLAELTGEAAIRFARAGDGLSVTLATVGDLEIDDAQLGISATVGIPDLANPRSVAVQTASHLTLSDGLTLSHDGGFELSWDDGLCFTLSGQLATAAGDDTFSTKIEALHRCAGECPDGTVTLGIGGAASGDLRTLQVVFDGDHTAEIILTTPERTRSIPVPILCG